MAKRLPSNKVIIEQLYKTGGNITATAKRLGCDRPNLSKKISACPLLTKAKEDAIDIIVDMAEGKLAEAINERDITAIIFMLKTKGKSRGYVERSEIAIDKNAVIKVGYDDDTTDGD